ncbi:CBS domain-containing protein [Micromonospora yasonensis]|uniref:CBS domain-containing protein n=1 Tax=Micromonospora yasonensis TaxID=1128667 RepID=UPI00222F00D3|nr:CBS domain-containing protein [Micromonospora yasonensis]MCW3843701.1 CBS domain-containing protein [Micromonospora yasonensis]
MTITTAGARFLAAFNEIEKHIRASLRADNRDGFAQLAREYADKKRLPTPHKSALLAFAALRNAISHERYYGGRPIAEPVEAVVQEIERLRQQILEPPRALTVLGSAKVCVVHPDDPIGAALDYVRTLGYSQLPVYDGDSYAGVLTTNAIARWLADQLTKNTGIAEEEPVSHVLKFAEPGEDAVLVPRAITVVEAIDRLSRERQAGYLSTALIITEHGRRTDKALRLVTPYDLPVLTAALAIT